MAAFVLMQMITLFILLGNFNYILDNCFCRFIYYHFWLHHGAYKKIIRFFDTLGNLLALLGLISGFCSLFIDQYDMDFELLGTLKTVIDGFSDFSKGIEDVASQVKKLISTFDFSITCKAIYSAVTAGTVAGVIASLIPGNFLSAKII